jgi:mannose-6-phosphate isomerase-like protein (cupin superfamily)
MTDSEAIETLVYNGEMYALIVRREFRQSGIHFFTPGDFSQQLAYMSRPAEYKIQPHFHREVQRDVHRTQEVLFVRKGRLRVDFYDTARRCIDSRILEAGDVILLAEGGHGFEMLEDCEIFEVKQGPYLGDGDKIRFDPE